MNPMDLFAQEPRNSLKKEGPSLTIYTDKSVYVNSKGIATEFAEGATNAATKMRLGKISTEFTAGYLLMLRSSFGI